MKIHDMQLQKFYYLTIFSGDSQGLMSPKLCLGFYFLMKNPKWVSIWKLVKKTELRQIKNQNYNNKNRGKFVIISSLFSILGTDFHKHQDILGLSLKKDNLDCILGLLTLVSPVKIVK